MSKITVNKSEISNSQIGDNNIKVILENPTPSEQKKLEEGFMHKFKFHIEILAGVITVIAAIYSLFTWIK